MVNNQTSQGTHLDATFQALADPTRRHILSRLAEGEATVGELARPFEISAPAISRHLRVLEGAGLLRRRVRGRTHLCSLVASPLRDATAWLTVYRRFWTERLDALEAYLEETAEEHKEKPSWPVPRPKPPSSPSGAPSRRRGRGSSKPGPNRRR